MRTKLFFALWIASIIIAPVTVVAHTLESKASIGAVLHIEPDDDPIVREPSELHFSVSDYTNRFNAQRCQCMLNISREGELVSSVTLAAPLRDQLETVYTFPEPGVYTLTVLGTPTENATFEPFSLRYDLRVTRTAGTSSGSGEWKQFLLTHGVHIILFGGAFVFIFGLYARDRYRQRRQRALASQNPVVGHN